MINFYISFLICNVPLPKFRGFCYFFILIKLLSEKGGNFLTSPVSDKVEGPILLCKTSLYTIVELFLDPIHVLINSLLLILLQYLQLCILMALEIVPFFRVST